MVQENKQESTQENSQPKPQEMASSKQNGAQNPQNPQNTPQFKTKRLFSDADLLRLFFPVVIEQFLEFSVGLVSSIMAAHVGQSAVSAVSIVEFVMALFISLFAAVAAGGSIVAGQYLGAGQTSRARSAARELVWFSLAFSSALMVLLYIFREPLFDFIFGDVAADVRQSANSYLLTVLLSMPFLALYASGAAIFRTMNNAKLPMQIMLFSNILNVALTALLIYGFGCGIFGIAAAALVARVISALIIIALLLDPSRTLRLKKTLRHKFNPRMIARILGIGLPFGFENTMFYIGRIIVLGVVSKFGTEAIAANAVGGTIALFQVLPGLAVGVGLSAVISKCVGANDFEQAKFYVRRSMIGAYVTGFFSAGLVLLLLEPILSLYALSEEALDLTRQIVWWHGAVMVLIWPLAYTFPVVFRSASDAKFPMAVSVACMFIFRIVFAYIFSLYLGLGMLGTWYAMFVDWAVKAVIFTHRYLSGRWIASALARKI